MNMKIKDSIVWTAFLAVMAIIMFPSCSDEHEAVILEITNNEIILQAEGDPVQVEVKSNTEWRIDFVESTWFSTDIRGAQSSRTYFTVTYDENISDSERFCDIRVFTKDGKIADVIKIKQLSRYPFIVPASDKMELFTKGGEYEMEISTNVPETDIVITPTVNWVQEYRISDGKLYFNTETNSQSPRTGSIVLSYDDQYQRKVTATINLSQAYSEYANAELVSYPTVHGYAVGGITNNVYVEGTIVANGTSKNFPSNRYVIQNEAGETVVFESESLITFAQFAKVSLCLKDGMIREESEGSFTYRLISGITAAHVISSELSTFTIPERTIAELTDNMVFSLVTLKDVEIASPVGAFTNFKTTDPGAADRKINKNYWVEKFPAYYRYYPTCIRDKNGSNTYMLTAFEAPYAHETLPKGSGSITGMVAKVKLTNFDISESRLCILPLNREDINISDINEITSVLVEWDCNVPDWKEIGSFTFTDYHPTGGEASQANALLSKDGNKYFQQTYADYILGFQDDFRGDVNLNTTDGYYGRMRGGAFNSKPWSTSSYFYVDKISTVGISTSLSLQVEMNASWGGGPVAVVEYAYSMNGEWIKVDNSEFTILGQFDRTAAGGQTEKNIPGYKVYDFKLPDALLNRDNICIRLRPVRLPAGVSSFMPLRLANISIKYNK